MTTLSPSTSLFRKHIALPQQHGSWALWLGPYVIGIGVGGAFKIELIWLTLASLGGVLLLQPLTTLINVIAGRKPQTDLALPSFGQPSIHSRPHQPHQLRSLITLYFVSRPSPPSRFSLATHSRMRREERGQMGSN